MRRILSVASVYVKQYKRSKSEEQGVGRGPFESVRVFLRFFHMSGDAKYISLYYSLVHHTANDLYKEISKGLFLLSK